ncbi:uncharacterized protein [Ptychodera flava]|uniref:uncharacterized protein n=1 Tax=Ptychodera flava TaxID=63121 RepID=UPI00396A7C51
MCSLLSPECSEYGNARQPCRHFCDEVESACRVIMEDGGTVWPLDCSDLPDVSESPSCVEISMCTRRPCHNEATCVPYENNYACVCATGWRGVNCTENIDDCDPNPCENGGSCIDGVNDYTCECAGLWSGRHCKCKDITIEECRNLPYKAYSLAVEGVRLRSEEEFRHFFSSTRPYMSCFPYIDVFMCSLFAPECTSDSAYRPPCKGFCEAARQHCEPQFITNGIPWPIDCSYLPESFDPAICLGREYIITDSSAICGTRTVSGPRDRIVGGRPAEDGEWPWQAAIYIDGSVSCGGSIINEEWILTAAHCMEDVSPGNIIAVMGVSDLRDTSAMRRAERRISEIHVHTEYISFNLHNDLALLKLVEPLEFSDYVRPVCLPPSGDDALVQGLPCSTTGWGLTSEGGQASLVLMEAEVNVLSQGLCQILHSQAWITYAMVCADGAENIDTCTGDSGGPLVYHSETDGKWYLAGVTSWGIGCGNTETPGVYARVGTALDWISEVTTFESPCEEVVTLQSSMGVNISLPWNQSNCVWKISSDKNILLTLAEVITYLDDVSVGTGDNHLDNTSLVFQYHFGKELPMSILPKSASIWMRVKRGAILTGTDLIVATAAKTDASGCQDVMADLEFECGPNDSLCFSSAQKKILCDRKNDCGDWKDEVSCTCHITFGLRCSNSGPCILRFHICDGYADCHEGEDEMECGAFQCNNGNTVYNYFVCDGVDDCGDRSDERGQNCCECQIYDFLFPLR